MKHLSLKLLAETVVACRKKLKLSQTDAAAKSGMNRSVYSRLEKQDYTPSVDQLLALSSVLGFSVGDVLEEEKEERAVPERKKIAVAGTGYVGLSLAVLLSQHHDVTAVDILPEKVEKLNNYISPIQDDYIEKFLDEAKEGKRELRLTATTDGHGTITPTQATVQGGGSQVFTIVPDNGYEIDYVTDNTMDVTANVSNNIYSLTNIGTDHDIYVAFHASSTPTDTYILTASTDGHGTITPTNATVNAGDSQTFTIAANSGFSLLSLTDNGTDVTAQVTNDSYTLTNIQSNHTLYATFQDDTPPVEPCEVPTNINMDENGLLTWTSDAQSWTVRYTVNGITYSVNISTLSFQIPGLQPGDVVDVTIQADCGNDNLSDWSANSSFTYNPNGVAQYRLTNIQLFPNPANETLHVRYDIPMQKVEIYNVVGGLMMTVEPNASSTDLNLSTLPSGVFFVRITADGQVGNGKFIKK